MKNKFPIIVSLCGISIIAFFVIGGQDILRNYNQLISLEFDHSNWLYSPGETINMKIKSQPFSNLVLKVVSPRNQIVIEDKIYSENGFIEHVLNLDPNLLQGTYIVIVVDESLRDWNLKELTQMNYHENVAVQRITII